ncbi:MAG: hypothetical protein ACYDEP_02615 [Acidimicrobiales bacterium]
MPRTRSRNLKIVLIVRLVCDRSIGVETAHGWRYVVGVLGASVLTVSLALDRSIGMEPAHGWRSVGRILETSVGVDP